MPLERPPLKVLRDRLETGVTSRLETDLPLLPRAVLRVLAVVFAGAIHMLYGALVAVANNFLETKAQGIWLVYLAARRGLSQRAASYAEGLVQFTGDEETVIPIGTVVSRGDGAEFETTETGTINEGTATVNVRAVVAGLAGNTAGGITLSLSSPVTGINSDITVNTGLTGGSDLEDLESLRTRLLYVIRNPGSGGSESDYTTWAFSIPGVFRVKIFGAPDYVETGAVAVVLAVEGDNPVPPDSLITAVDNYIQPLKPADAAVDVRAVEIAEVVLEVSISPHTEDVKAAVRASLETFFQESVSARMKITRSALDSAITAGGATDHEITEIHVNGDTDPVGSRQLTGFQYPVLMALTLNDLDE